MEMIVQRQNSSLSWSRLQMVMAYYFPVLKKQIIWYPIVVTGLYMLAYLCQMVDWLAPVSIVFISPFSFMFYWAPIILARNDNRMVTSLLPATAVEKITFLTIYFFVVIPILIYGVEAVLIGLTQWFTPQYEFVLCTMEVARSAVGDVFFLGQLDELLPAALCFWGVIYFKENRTLKSLLVSGGSLVAIGVASGIYAAFFAVKMIIDADNAGAQFNEDDFKANIALNMEPLMIAIGVFSVLFAIFMVWLSFRRIKNYQC